VQARSPDDPENREPDDPAQLDFLQSAYAHIMGRTAYEAIAGSMTTSTDHPFADILNAGRKVVFSRRRPTGPTPPSPLVTRQKRSRIAGS
jgi:dihydrofolate reductase